LGVRLAFFIPLFFSLKEKGEKRCRCFCGHGFQHYAIEREEERGKEDVVFQRERSKERENDPRA
jgi:hypothetical protein